MVKNGIILLWKVFLHYLEEPLIHKEEFCCFNCFHSYTPKNKLKNHENVCKNCDYCYVEIPNEDNKILKHSQGEKSIKVPFIMYADLEPLLEKMSTYHDNSKNSSTAKINKHAPSGYSLFTHCSFDLTKNKLDCYRGKDWFKRAYNKNNQLLKKKKRYH